MILIAENIHIISKSVKQAIENKDFEFLKNLLTFQQKVDCIELNIGPVKNKHIFDWLVPFVKENSNLPISFDTSNVEEIATGLELFKNNENCFINSATKDDIRFKNMSDLALKHACNLILLTLDPKTGIPKDSDGRLEIVFELYEKCMEKGLNNSKLFFDPLILPLSVDQKQAIEAINSVRMIKESFDPPTKTIIGLSNISNGSPKELRPLINRVFACFAHGAGVDAMIIDANDLELIRVLKMLEAQKPQNETDRLYLQISKISKDFGNFSNIKYNIDDEEQKKIIKTVNIISGQKIYTHNFTQI